MAVKPVPHTIDLHHVVWGPSSDQAGEHVHFMPPTGNLPRENVLVVDIQYKDTDQII